jgi:hypothetical protein
MPQVPGDCIKTGRERPVLTAREEAYQMQAPKYAFHDARHKIVSRAGNAPAAPGIFRIAGVIQGTRLALCISVEFASAIARVAPRGSGAGTGRVFAQ